MSLSIGATGIILSFRDLGNISHTPLAKCRPDTGVSSNKPFKNFVLQERVCESVNKWPKPVLTCNHGQKGPHRRVLILFLSKNNDLGIL